MTKIFKLNKKSGELEEVKPLGQIMGIDLASGDDKTISLLCNTTTSNKGSRPKITVESLMESMAEALVIPREFLRSPTQQHTLDALRYREMVLGGFGLCQPVRHRKTVHSRIVHPPALPEPKSEH